MASERTYVGPAMLSEIQLEILEAVSNGHSNKQIGRRRGVTTDTINGHLGITYRKLGARDRAHAVRRGFELGYLNCDTTELTSYYRG